MLTNHFSCSFTSRKSRNQTMSSDYDRLTRTIVHWAMLTGVSFKKITESYNRADGQAVFPNLCDANAVKQSLTKSFGRFKKSTKLASDGVSRLGSKGQVINWHPLPESFDIETILFRKPNAQRYLLPAWTREIYESQWEEGHFNPNGTAPNDDTSANPPPRNATADDLGLANGTWPGVIDDAAPANGHLGRAVRGNDLRDNAFVDPYVGNGWVKLAVNPSLLRQGEVHDGEEFDFTIQLQVCPEESIGITGEPFNIAAVRSVRGAFDNKRVAHDSMTILFPTNHAFTLPLLKDKEFMPRFTKDRTSIIIQLRRKSHYTTRNQPFITLSPSHSFNSQVIRISSSFPLGSSTFSTSLGQGSTSLMSVLSTSFKPMLSIFMIVCWPLIMILPRTRRTASASASSSL